MEPVFQYAVENRPLPAFDLQCYRGADSDLTDLTRVPVIPDAIQTRPHRKLMAAPTHALQDGVVDCTVTWGGGQCSRSRCRFRWAAGVQL